MGRWYGWDQVDSTPKAWQKDLEALQENFLEDDIFHMQRQEWVDNFITLQMNMLKLFRYFNIAAICHHFRRAFRESTITELDLTCMLGEVVCVIETESLEAARHSVSCIKTADHTVLRANGSHSDAEGP